MNKIYSIDLEGNVALTVYINKLPYFVIKDRTRDQVNPNKLMEKLIRVGLKGIRTAPLYVNWSQLNRILRRRSHG